MQAYERGETERMREAFINIQNTIEAIDRGIKHEKTLAGVKPNGRARQPLRGPQGQSGDASGF